MRDEADDGRGLLQSCAKLRHQRQRLDGHVVQVNDDQRWALIFRNIILRMFQNLINSFYEFHFDIELLGDLLDLGKEEQVVDEAEDACWSIRTGRYGRHVRDREAIGLLEAGTVRAIAVVGNVAIGLATAIAVVHGADKLAAATATTASATCTAASATTAAVTTLAAATALATRAWSTLTASALMPTSLLSAAVLLGLSAARLLFFRAASTTPSAMASSATAAWVLLWLFWSVFHHFLCSSSA